MQSAAEHAYEAIGAGYKIDPANMPRSGTCRMTSLAMKWQLQNMGFDDVVTEVRSTPLTKKHYYLSVFACDQLLVADPTWQQFIARHQYEDLPNVLFGTQDEVVDFALNAGVHPLDAGLWSPQIVPQYAVNHHPSSIRST